MTTQERAAMLTRFSDADRWLARVYDRRTRTDEHRVAMWEFLMGTAERRFKNILLATRDIDESSNRFWQQYKN